MSARQLLDHVWLVGGADADVRTDLHDCHVYLLHDGARGLLIDAGTGLAHGRLLTNIGEVCDPGTLEGVLVTHYHADHAGGASAFSRAGVPVLASATSATALIVGDEDRTSLARARAVGVYPSDYVLAPARVDEVLEDGDPVTAGGLQIKVLDAAGHCDGHLAFLVEGPVHSILFSGDTVFAGGRVSIQALHDCRLDRYADTLQRLDKLAVDVLLAGHGEPVLDDAGAGIRAAAESFYRLVPPPNILS